MSFKSLRIIFVLVLSFVALGSHAKTAIEFSTQEFPPYNFVQKGELAGAISELISKACQQTNLDCTFKLHQYWGTAIKAVKNDKSSALFVVGKNKQREQWLNFTNPILPAEYGFFALKEDFKYQQLSDLAGLKVGVYGPSNTASQLALLGKSMKEKGIEPIKISWTYSSENAFEKMIRGKVDVVYSNKAVGDYYNQGLADPFKMRYLGKHLDLMYYIAFNKKLVSAETVNKFNRALTRLKNNGNLDKLLTKYQLP